MDWHQLKYFQILASICNFSKAAEELTLSQSALSRTISRLEEEIGVPLFERKSRGVVLNRYGELFLEHVNRALGEIDEAKKKSTIWSIPCMVRFHLALFNRSDQVLSRN